MVLSVMEFLIYLQIDDGKLYYKIMKPRDTLNYEFVLSDEIHKNLPEGFNQVGMEQINRVLALRCYYTMSELRLKMKQYKTPGAKFIRLEKYYEEVLSRYEDFFEGKIQFPQWRLDEANNIPSFATNLVTEENIRLSPKQGKFVKLFHEHFTKNKIGEEWMWFSEAYNRLEERYKNPNWNSMTDIFEKREGKEKLDKLFDVKTEGSKRYYRIKSFI